ncbi:MAG: sulfatase-like hydrolase/transferase [Kiritimatiellae bacterium]|nr:sulfatase-like hydrolase/transferase [Kiritimatiellia bacterium]
MSQPARKRPNVLWLMSDQHNANCTGYAGHPNVKTPSLDGMAERGVTFTSAFANNPICSPSRICFMSSQYMRTHRMFGNDHAEYPHPNPDTLACLFRRYGYQTGLFGKSHMVRRWDEDGFERIRYTDLCDSRRGDPLSMHYFKYLDERGLADWYEEGTVRMGMEYTMDGSGPAKLPYEHSIEHFTGEETLRFLAERDATRPFFIHMSFQRPHAPIAPAAEYFDMYDPAEIVLPDSAADFYENRFAGKPACIRNRVKDGGRYPLADPNVDRLKRCLASYYALITCIDMEIGRVIETLEREGELENTIVFYTADHGDFAGEHGLFHKNLGIYDSIQRIPFLLSWPGGPRGTAVDDIVESVDLYPTLCALCDVPLPAGREGRSVLPLAQPGGAGGWKDAAFCEWETGGTGPISAIRTRSHRLVYYGGRHEGELYDHRDDPGEIRNLWSEPAHTDTKLELLQRLMDFTMRYGKETDHETDRRQDQEARHSPSRLLHKHRRYWSRLTEAYTEESSWPPRRAIT